MPGGNRLAQFPLLFRGQDCASKTPDFRLGVPATFEHGEGGFAEDLWLPMFLQRHPRHGDENGQVQQVRDSVWAGGDGAGLGPERDLPLQRFRGRHGVRAPPALINADDHPRGKLVREPQQRLLHLDRVHPVRPFPSRCDGAHSLPRSIHGGLQDVATGPQRQEGEGREYWQTRDRREWAAPWQGAMVLGRFPQRHCLGLVGRMPLGCALSRDIEAPKLQVTTKAGTRHGLIVIGVHADLALTKEVGCPLTSVVLPPYPEASGKAAGLRAHCGSRFERRDHPSFARRKRRLGRVGRRRASH